MSVKNEKLKELVRFHIEQQDKDRNVMRDMRSELENIENRVNKSDQLKQ